MNHHHHPDITVAWLLLSHSGFIIASIAATSVSVSLAIVKFSSARFASELKSLAVIWNIGSLMMTLWTMNAIHITWKESLLADQKFFKTPSFASLGFVTLFFGLANLATLYLILKPFKEHKQLR